MNSTLVKPLDLLPEMYALYHAGNLPDNKETAKVTNFKLLRDAWLCWHPEHTSAERDEAMTRLRKECGL